MNEKKQIIGIIGEYNPIHLGHIYQINKIKKTYPNSLIILITNTAFTERGDVSILNKWDKTKISLENNIDLVVELPFPYATQSADIFANGALKILNYLKINILVFGSESNEIDKLSNIAKTQLTNKKYQEKVKDYLKTGINYPTALSKAIKDILGYTISEPNDLLGISYIKEIIKNNYPIIPITIKRIGSYYETETTTNIASASLIRKKIQENQSISQYIPNNTEKYLYKNLTLENYFPYLKYKIMSEDDLSIYQTVDEGIENRLKKEILNTNSWQELIEKVKTKRYTYNKINRMLVHILTSFTKEESKKIKIDYIKILGFNTSGRNYLNQLKKEIKIPIITSYQKNFSQTLDLEHRASSIYYLPINQKFILNEYNKKPIIKD
ncbi:MAG: nucleotidyltransferase [Bacilli bacterium]|nr:nucleotidyltransferase [Bacilli bacterium]